MQSADFIQKKGQLVDYFRCASKSQADWRVGLEYEKFIFQRNTLKRAPFSGQAGVESLLKGLIQMGWQPVFEAENLISLRRGQSTITLEPGGQVELSSAQHQTLEALQKELLGFEEETHRVASELGLKFIVMGYDPISPLEEMPWMPKGRYAVMRKYMPKRGRLGVNMMKGTAAIQVALDYSSEKDMARKFRLALSVQPIITGILANSCFVAGKPAGYQSYRSHIWSDTDPERCGLLKYVFEKLPTFEDYVDYALDVPMYFIHHGNQYVDVSGHPFRDYLEGKLPGYEEQMPRLQDWEDHLTTIFTEVRLKRFLEIRGVDACETPYALGVAAFWVGLLYDQKSLGEAYTIIEDWSYEEVKELLSDVAKEGMRGQLRGVSVKDWAETFLDISEDGLSRLKNFAKNGDVWLRPLREIITSGKTLTQKSQDIFLSCENDMNKAFGNFML